MTMRLQLWIYIVTIVITIECGHGHRTKRRIAFPKGSSFFYRLNYKINSLAWTTIFAQATGFKVAWPLPDSSRTQRSIGNILDDINLLYESHGFNGPSCIAKNFCEALNYIKQKDGVLVKIIKIIMRNPQLRFQCFEFQLESCRKFTSQLWPSHDSLSLTIDQCQQLY
ncbi:hypothetical protein PV327_005856 [Microctonus hyperodae]|uniref:Uncharacterized protein n=1 Tax=Microctonus hyperodae TaxID=165561 RepID=A0AA39G298_MICHY|nr:hypothetical protein PV327_005856 [Microctonus hyperodae]